MKLRLYMVIKIMNKYVIRLKFRTDQFFNNDFYQQKFIIKELIRIRGVCTKITHMFRAIIRKIV